MGDFELLGAEGPKEKMSEEDFEKFREQMRDAAKAMAAAQKGEQRQQKKEDVLARILLKFFQSAKSASHPLLIAAIKLLQMNIPPVFVLSLLLLGDRELQEELEKIETEGEPPKYNLVPIERTLLRDIPEAIAQELERWMHLIQHQAHMASEKLLQYGADHDKKPRQKVIDLPSLVLQSYLRRNEVSFEPTLAEEFVRLMLEKIFQEVKK